MPVNTVLSLVLSRTLGKPFEVTTRFQNAAGESKLGREYGIVNVSGSDLGEMLVSNGLARIHGVNVGGIGAERVERLRKIEAGARTARPIRAFVQADRHKFA